MISFFLPELVDTALAERAREAESARIAAEAGRGSPKPRLRPRVALALGALAARIHPEAARHAVGLRVSAANGPSGRPRLCLCDD